MQIDDAGTDDHPAAYPSAITPSASASAAAAAAGVSASSSLSSTPHQSCSASSNLLVHVPASPPMDAATVDAAQTMKEISALHACCIYCARLEEMEVAEEAGSGWVSVSKLGRSEYVNHIHSAVRYRSRILINTGPPLSHCTHPAHHLCPDHAAAPPVMRSLRSSDAAGDPLAVESASVAMGTKTREQVKDSLAAMPHSQATSHSSHCGGVSPHCHSSLDGNGSAEQCFVSPPRGAVDAATPLSSTALSSHRTSNAAHTPATTNAPTHSTASVVSMPHSSSLTTQQHLHLHLRHRHHRYQHPIRRRASQSVMERSIRRRKLVRMRKRRMRRRTVVVWHSHRHRLLVVRPVRIVSSVASSFASPRMFVIICCGFILVPSLAFVAIYASIRMPCAANITRESINVMYQLSSVISQ